MYVHELLLTRVSADAYVCHRLAGPPITNETAVTVLLEHGVTVALGVTEAWEPVNTRFDAGWVSSSSLISRESSSRHVNIPAGCARSQWENHQASAVRPGHR